ncbi:MAG TPA: GNAT family N-acetyltransferase [Opitutaceae bacterium]|nr:GNAT family N-acetyltransferase [Opitutaceae bacterium]
MFELVLAVKNKLPAAPVLRALTPADYDAVFALWQASEGMGLNESDTRDAIASYLVRNPGLSLVAEVENKIAGAVLCGHDGRRGYLHHLAVAHQYRRSGLGRALVDESLARLRAQGITKCNIFLYAANAAGRAFWLHEGWAPREDLVVVQKSVSARAQSTGC